MPGLSDIRFDALRNALYHKARQQYFEFLNRFSNFSVVILGTAISAKGFGFFGVQNYELFIGLLTSIIGALKLVYDFSGRAKNHEILQKKYYDILSEIALIKSEDQDNIRSIDSKMIKIYGEEPPIMRALDSVAFNDARDALGSENGDEDNISLRLYHYIFKHMYAFPNSRFRTYKELKGGESSKRKDDRNGRGSHDEGNGHKATSSTPS